MKKLLIYSLIIITFSFLTGAMFVYGVFDFNDGKSQLIDSQQNKSEAEIHNEIVESIHGISTNAISATESLLTFEPYGDANPFHNYFSQFKSSKKTLLHAIETDNFSARQIILKDEFLQNYAQPIENFENIGIEIAAYLNEETLDPEKILSFKTNLQASLDKLIEAHNNYIVTLNKKRRY